jgi:Family of unknown function (DUF6909)
MERKVPSTISEEIELYLQTLYSLMRSTADVQLRTLEEVHCRMSSSLHPEAGSDRPDVSAFIYSMLRLPPVMPQVKLVVLGQSPVVFEREGIGKVESWQEVSARARRRRVYFDGKHTLACYIASRSDIDDVVPALTAYQIEWNKIHDLLETCPPEWIENAPSDAGVFVDLAGQLKMSVEDLRRLQTVMGKNFVSQLRQMADKGRNLRLRLLSSSLSEYRRATRTWWDNIQENFPGIENRPVYFLSSNTHSLVNLVTGFAFQHEEELIRFLEAADSAELLQEWQDIQARNIPSNRGNFLYYVLKKYQKTKAGRHLWDEQLAFEQQHGITRIPSTHSFDVEAQVIDLAKLDPEKMDFRLKQKDWAFLQHSNAVILNIDYPLGMSAYNILSKVAEQVSSIEGVYIIGKAASLNGKRGDVMVPTVVQDEHSHNTYMFRNTFSAAEISPYLVYGTVLDNQKAVTVLGTFLQNKRVMDVMYRESYTDIEMEGGPYLSAMYEMYRPKRHPMNEIVSLHRVPFDIGLVHYASDTPMSKGKNLGAGTLSYYGMDSTYAVSIAVMRRIFEQETRRLEGDPDCQK